MFTPKQAKRVADFYKAVKPHLGLLICQCEHGESRSAAIAAAIMQYEYNSGMKIFSNEKYLPNKTVYKMVLDALNGSNG